MNHNFIRLFNQYKLGYARKNKKLILKYSQQNMLFVHFLLRNKLISGLFTEERKKNKAIVLFIKYDSKLLSALADFSLSSKVAFNSSPIKAQKLNERKNFTLNLTSTEGKYTRLLARIR